MPRATFVLRGGRLVEKHGPDDTRARPARSHLAAPMVIGDTMVGVKSMHDGMIYDSKSALRASYRAAGLVELGNDAPTAPAGPARPPMTAADVGEAYQMVRQGYRPAPLETSIIPETA